MEILLETPSSVQLRAAFEKFAYRRTRLKATYDELLELFRDPSRTFEAIAKSVHLTVEPLRACYRRYFQPVFGISGNDRRRERIRQRKAQALRALPMRKPVFSHIIKGAGSAGLTVECVPSTGATDTSRVRHWALRIEGHLCQIHVLTAACQCSEKPDAQRFVLLSIDRASAARYDAHIVVIQIGMVLRILVVPSYVIGRIGGQGPDARARIILGQNKRPVRIDWWKYENAWYLLERED